MTARAMAVFLAFHKFCELNVARMNYAHKQSSRTWRSRLGSQSPSPAPKRSTRKAPHLSQ